MTRRIAAIDVGTNSIHMIVAERRGRDTRIVDREKATVQLGLGSLDGAPLRDDAIDRGVDALARMAEIARGWNADEIVAVATSAVREAPNRRAFLRRAKKAAGIDVRVISGEEEADSIYRAVRAHADLGDERTLIVDIGGGSVEMIVGTATGIEWMSSEPLGALRMAQRFDLLQSADKKSIAACRRFVSEHLPRPPAFSRCIGTSGTVAALAPTTRTELAEKLARFAKNDRSGYDEKRATTIVAGAAVLLAIMESFDIQAIVPCPAAIREGIVAERFGERMTSKRAAAIAFAERNGCDEKHARRVAKLARSIFDQTKSLHRLKREQRELLEAAALLHDVGLHVSDRAYHKHSWYLIRHAALRGFTDAQLAVVANVARYHRKAPPRDGHRNLAELTAKQRAVVEKLAAILRIAEALDRSHRQSVKTVEVECKRTVAFRVDGGNVDVAAAAKAANVFKEVFRRDARFERV